jgi:hypothetical protein
MGFLGVLDERNWSLLSLVDFSVNLEIYFSASSLRIFRAFDQASRRYFLFSSSISPGPD